MEKFNIKFHFPSLWHSGLPMINTKEKNMAILQFQTDAGPKVRKSGGFRLINAHDLFVITTLNLIL